MPVFEITFLGTAASTPTHDRGLPSMLIHALDDGRRIMVDCGEGTLRQMIRSKTKMRLDAVLFTHRHLDHMMGIGGLLSSYNMLDIHGAIQIFGGEKALERVQALIKAVVFPDLGKLKLPVEYHTVKQGKLIFDSPAYQARAIEVTHRGPDVFGYVFERATKRPFLADKAAALGIPADRRRSLLMAGQSVVSDMGQTVHPDDVTGEVVRGLKMVVLGDIGDFASVNGAAKNADVLICECTYMSDNVDLARQHRHITAQEVGQFAAENNIANVILTHVSSRYSADAILWEVKQGAGEHPLNAWIANDFDTFRADPKGVTKLNG